MHYQYWPLAVQVPASTPEAGPVSAAFDVVQGHMKQVEIQIPTGHNGLTGMRLLYQGQQIYPWANYSWLTDNGALRICQWGDEIMGTGLSVQAWNTDTVPHAFYLLAEIWPTVDPASASAEAGLGGPETVTRVAAATARIATISRTAA
jgi:hypothetical protein